MKRNFIIGFFGLSAAALLGCPVFSGDGTGNNCGGGSYYGSGGPYTCCTYTSECPSGYLCESNYCIAPGYEAGTEGGGDGGGGGDCTVTGCSKGHVCAVVDGGAVCVAIPEGGIKDGTSDAPPFKGCTSDAACSDAGAGYLCLDGKCVAPDNQCTDTTQCPNSEQCVQGACVPGCNPASSSSCPTGYSCTSTGTSTGVCTGNPTPCTAADSSKTCAKGDTCVDTHCVPKCSGGDAACGTGLVCVDNGCIPDQTPNFVCKTNGQAGDGKKGDCDLGSTCLHHNCYIACDPMGADAGGFCNTATGTKYPDCKSVTESNDDGGTGSFSVCGSSTNLGSDCDLTSTPPKPCTTSGQVCIDGFCR